MICSTLALRGDISLLFRANHSQGYRRTTLTNAVLIGPHQKI
jgi:hypothetical protein